MKTFTFRYESEISAPASMVFKWHEHPHAFQRLVPPFDPVKLIKKDKGLKKGVKALIAMGYPPFALYWHALHTECIENSSFTDKQIKGPCSFWEHKHEMIPKSDKTSLLRDTVTYRVLCGINIDRKLKQLFKYRHQITKCDLFMQSHYRVPDQPIAVLGKDSFLKRRLISFLKVIGCTIKTDSPFDHIIYFGDTIDRTYKTKTVIHVSENQLINAFNTERYVHLAPTNLLFDKWGLIKQLKQFPLWNIYHSLKNNNIQWIHLDDAVYNIYFSLISPAIAGSFSLANKDTLNLEKLFILIKNHKTLNIRILKPKYNLNYSNKTSSLFEKGSPFFIKNFNDLIDVL